MNDIKTEEKAQSTYMNILKLQHPVMLLWLVSTFIFIFSGYVLTGMFLD